jgi:outer membrane protein TolC
MSRTERAVLGVCLFGVLGLGPISTGPAWSAPALKDPTKETRQARELKQQRVQAIRAQLQGAFERVKIGKDSVIDFLQSVRDLYVTEVSLADAREEKLAVVEKAVQILFVCDEQITQLNQAGLVPFDSVQRTRAARASAELELEKLKSGK